MTRTFEIKIVGGLGCRPISAVMKLCEKFKGTVTLENKDGKTCGTTGIMDIMMLACAQGENIKCIVTCYDDESSAEALLDDLGKIFERELVC